MLFRLSVQSDTIDTKSRTFQARGETPEIDPDAAEAIARDLESGAVARFYRGGTPQGRVVSARPTGDGLWVKIRIRPRDVDTWRLVETGAVNTIEVQTFTGGVDAFLKSSPATYPTTA